MTHESHNWGETADELAAGEKEACAWEAEAWPVAQEYNVQYTDAPLSADEYDPTVVKAFGAELLITCVGDGHFNVEGLIGAGRNAGRAYLIDATDMNGYELAYHAEEVAKGGYTEETAETKSVFADGGLRP